MRSIDKEYQKYGYSGYSDNIQYDTWTNEIIPKQEIATYNNDEKYITNSKGEQIKFLQIKVLLDEFGEIQGSYASISKDKIQSIDYICNTLLRDYLDLDYETKSFDNSDDKFVIKIKGDYEDSYYSEISTRSELEGLVKEVIQDKYKKQNNLNK